MDDSVVDEAIGQSRPDHPGRALMWLPGQVVLVTVLGYMATVAS